MMRVLIFSVILVTVQSYTMEHLRIRSAIPRVKTIELFTGIKAIKEIYDPMDMNYKNEASQINFEANTIKEFLNKYNKSFNTLEKMITDTLFNDITRELWKFCVLVLAQMKQYSEKTKLTVEDFNVIGFTAEHSYNLISYLHQFKYNVGILIHVILYFQSLKYIQFGTDVVSEITKQVTYFKDNLKLINGDVPENEDKLSKLDNENIKKLLRGFENNILNTDTIFQQLNLPKLIITNLVLQPDSIQKTPMESIEHVMKMEDIDLTVSTQLLCKN